MRKLFLAALGCVVLMLAGYAGYRAYAVGKRGHLLALARGFEAKADRRNAVLALTQVLRSDPRNLEATRMMAGLAEAGRLPGAVMWRSRVVELNPLSLEDRIALAKSAITMRDYASATNALEGVDGAGKRTALYQNVAGAVAAATGQTALAEEHFQEAARLEPANLVPQMNLAVVRLHGTNTARLAEARAALQALSANPTNSDLRCEALRELALDSMRQNRGEAALALAAQLLRETNATFADSVLRLGVLQATRNAAFKEALLECQRAAAGDSGRIFELSSWQMANSGPLETLAWLKTLPAGTRTNQPAALMITECYAINEDWPELQKWLGTNNWAELEFIRHAFLSQAFRGQDMASSAKLEWEQSLKAANGQKESLVMLVRLAAQWNRVNEVEDLLWTIVTRYPQEKWATQALTKALLAGSQTRSLMQLFDQELKRAPSDLNAKNNLAMTALLLDAKELRPHDLAREIYRQAPTNSTFAATYAYSLYVQQKNDEALKVIEKLKPQELQDPAVAGYYGLILLANGNRAQARTYLNLASKANLLPEERKLFEKARSGG